MRRHDRAMRRFEPLKTLLAIALPFLLPIAGLAIWLISEASGQPGRESAIIASIDASGTGVTYLSTTLPDGNIAEWTCSEGRFSESGEPSASGRSVTWLPDEGSTDSVTITVTTPSLTDSVRFLSFIPRMNPSITVSAAYHLAVTDRARCLSLSPGAYTAFFEDDNLSGYDGLVILVVQEPGRQRRAFVAMPGDSLALDLPLGGEVRAFGADRTEDALDNGGSVLITFIPLESVSP